MHLHHPTRTPLLTRYLPCIAPLHHLPTTTARHLLPATFSPTLTRIHSTPFNLGVRCFPTRHCPRARCPHGVCCCSVCTALALQKPVIRVSSLSLLPPPDPMLHPSTLVRRTAVAVTCLAPATYTSVLLRLRWLYQVPACRCAQSWVSPCQRFRERCSCVPDVHMTTLYKKHICFLG